MPVEERNMLVQSLPYQIKSSGGKSLKIDISTHDKNVGGFAVKFPLDHVSEKFRCPFCVQLMKDPLQTGNGRLACRSCYLNAKGDSPLCPLDNEEVQTFIDRATGNEILQLRCRCKNRNFGCSWAGKVQDIEMHELSCDLEPTKCTLCLQDADSMEGHLEKCEYITNRTQCIYKGCNFKPSVKETLSEHLKTNASTHMILSQPIIERVQKENELLKEKIDEMQQEFKKFKQEKEHDIIKLINVCDVLCKKQNKLQSDIDELNTKAKKTQHSNNQDGKKKDELATMETTISIIDKNLKDLDLRQQLLENICYDGKLIWKIDNYKTRKQQAVTGEVTALHSAPAFTSRYGYKFCGRLYLNGDGNGKGTHASLFFVVMKSEYDNLCKWPFKNRVTFKISTQEGCPRTIKESFVPDENSGSFQKPTKEMNIAAGCPMFISHIDLETGGFLKDNSFFIEIVVG